MTALLDNPRIGVVHLDRRGRILAVNDRARSLLRHGAGLSDEEGVLQARAPDDQGRLARLVAEALPTSGAVPVSGSMLLGRVSGLPPFVVHVKPVGVPQPDYGARHVAALVLSPHCLATTNPGSDGKVLKALVLAVLQLWPLAAGSLQTQPVPLLGHHPRFGFLEEPETNGVVERWNRTLKEQAVYGRVFLNLADLRAAVAEFVKRYNQCWRIARQAKRARNTSYAMPRSANVCPRNRVRSTLSSRRSGIVPH